MLCDQKILVIVKLRWQLATLCDQKILVIVKLRWQLATLCDKRYLLQLNYADNKWRYVIKDICYS